MMNTFQEFLSEIASRGEAVNIAFEERLFQLASIVRRITEPLGNKGVPHELVGGMAVLVHLEAADPSLTMLTRDVDLMIRRVDLARVQEIAACHGFNFRHSAGLDMLIGDLSEKARNAVHLIFSGERVREGQVTPNPPILPERGLLQGIEVPVIRVPDLVRMKLSAYRDKDRVHVRAIDAAGLVTSEIEAQLLPELRERLKHVRETE